MNLFAVPPVRISKEELEEIPDLKNWIFGEMNRMLTEELVRDLFENGIRPCPRPITYAYAPTFRSNIDI